MMTPQLLSLKYYTTTSGSYGYVRAASSGDTGKGLLITLVTGTAMIQWGNLNLMA